MGMTSQPAEILAEFGPFSGVSNIGGVTFDGTCAWLATGERLLAVTTDGARARELHVRASAGTAFDGKHLWQIADGKIRKLDPETGVELAVVPAPPNTDYAGLTWAEGALWVAEYKGRKVVKLDPATGRVLRTIDSNRMVTGVTWAEGELWHGATSETEPSELRHVAEDGAVLETLTMPEGKKVSGIEYDGDGRFYVGGGGAAVLRVVRKPKKTG